MTQKWQESCKSQKIKNFSLWPSSHISIFLIYGQESVLLQFQFGVSSLEMYYLICYGIFLLGGRKICAHFLLPFFFIQSHPRSGYYSFRILNVIGWRRRTVQMSTDLSSGFWLASNLKFNRGFCLSQHWYKMFLLNFLVRSKIDNYTHIKND